MLDECLAESFETAAELIVHADAVPLHTVALSLQVSGTAARPLLPASGWRWRLARRGALSRPPPRADLAAQHAGWPCLRWWSGDRLPVARAAARSQGIHAHGDGDRADHPGAAGDRAALTRQLPTRQRRRRPAVPRWARPDGLRAADAAARPLAVLTILTPPGRAIAEVGAVMIVGGNIAGVTRVMTTTSIARSRPAGRPAAGDALGIVLIAVVGLVVNRSSASHSAATARRWRGAPMPHPRTVDDGAPGCRMRRLATRARGRLLRDVDLAHRGEWSPGRPEQGRARRRCCAPARPSAWARARAGGQRSRRRAWCSSARRDARCREQPAAPRALPACAAQERAQRRRAGAGRRGTGALGDGRRARSRRRAAAPAIARAWRRRPGLFLDEPTGSLDPTAKKEVRGTSSAASPPTA